MNSEAELCRILKHCTWNENSLICPEKYRQETIQTQRDKSAVFFNLELCSAQNAVLNKRFKIQSAKNAASFLISI